MICDASEILAKNAAIFKNISEDMSIDEATEGMVSSIKAFDIAAEDSLDGIISKVNVLGNEFAVSNKDINEALMRSASAMAAANNSIDETMALITAGTEITQDAASMGTALKTVSMRIRGLDEEGEALGDTLANIKGELYDLTGVSIMQDPDTFKSTYQIFKEIADVWDSLTDVNQAEVLELLAGKRQGNVVAAILSNFDQAEAALEASMNSAGGAMTEQERAMDSIRQRQMLCVKTFTGMWQNLINAEALKFLLDMGTTLASLLNVANGLPAKLIALVTLVTTLKALKDALKVTAFGKTFINSITSVITGFKNAGAAVQIFVEGVRGGNGVVKSFSQTLSAAGASFNPVVLGIGAVTAALAIGVTAWNAYYEAKEKAAQTTLSDAENELSEIESEISSLSELEKQLKAAQGDKRALAQIQDELNEKIGATPGLIDGEANAYSRASKEIERRIKLLEQEQKAALDKKAEGNWHLMMQTEQIPGGLTEIELDEGSIRPFPEGNVFFKP